MKKLLIAIITLLFIATSSEIIAQNDPVILTVAGENITKSEFLNVYQKNNINGEALDQKSLKEYMDLYINFRLKVKEAEDLGLDTLKAFKDELAGYRKQLAQPYLIDDKMNEALLKEAYNRKKSDIRASHILIKVDRNASPQDTLAAYKKAMSLRKRALKGEDFGLLAAEYSDDLSARDRDAEGRKFTGNRGDLGYFTVFDMVYPFESGAYNTPEGEISMPVRSDFGYHLIKVVDRKPALGRVQVAHILLKVPENATAADSALVEQKAKDLYNRIINGEDFARLAEQNSDDKSTANKGGVLPWFGANKMIPEFIKSVSAIKNLNEVAPPFSSFYGWHIVKLLDRKEIGTYEDNINELKQSLTRSDRAKKSEEALVNRIKQEYKFSESPKNLAAINKIVTDTIFAAGWKVPANVKLNKTLFTIGRRSYSQLDFANNLEKNQRRQSKQNIEAYVQDKLNAYINTSLIEYEDSMLESKYPDFKALVKEYRDGILLFELTDQKVWSKAVKDTAGLEAFYEQNKYNYMWGERLDATIYSLDTINQELSTRLRKAIKKGITDTEILEQFNTDSTTLLTIERHKFSSGDNAMIDSIEWQTGLSPEILDEGRVHMILVHKLLAPEPRLLNEARGIITADYQNYLEKEWIKELRRKYDFDVKEEVLSSIK